MPNQDPQPAPVSPDTGQVQEGSIGQRLARALESLVELQIYTCVGTPEFEVRQDPESGLTLRPKDGKVAVSTTCYTEINLVSGDIINLVPEAHLAADDPLRAIHAAQVESGLGIVKQNVETLRDLLKDANEELRAWLRTTPARGGQA